MTIGLLSTMLSGAYFGSEVTHMYDDLENPQNIGHLFGALPIGAFESLVTYFERMRKAGADVRGVRLAPGVDRVYLPGEREAALAEARRRDGTPLGIETWRELAALGPAAGVRVPAVIAAPDP
jgi:LDH2 family malate/lactate/ureidoglycolate dehydrogenase